MVFSFYSEGSTISKGEEGMSSGTPRTARPNSANSKKTRRTVEENEIVGAKGTRISPSVLDHGFHTDKYKTHYSAWTPVINSASNSQVRKRCNASLIEILRLFKFLS